MADYEIVIQDGVGADEPAFHFVKPQVVALGLGRRAVGPAVKPDVHLVVDHPADIVDGVEIVEGVELSRDIPLLVGDGIGIADVRILTLTRIYRVPTGNS